MPLAGDFSTVYQPPLDRITVFVASDNGHLYDKYWNGREWVWQDQGIPLGATGVAVASASGAVYQPTLDRIIVFVVGLGSAHLYDKYWNGREWVWEDQGFPAGATGPPGEPLLAASAVYRQKLDRIIVFVVGFDDGHLYDKYWNGSEWVWEDQGMPSGPSFLNTPSAVYQQKLDRIIVFVVGDDSHLYDKYWDGSKWIWEPQGIPPETSSVGDPPSAVYQPTLDRIWVFVVADNGHLYDKYWNGREWVWEDQGMPSGTTRCRAPSAVYQQKLDRIIVFVVGNDGHLYDKYWDGREWVWQDQGMPSGTTSATDVPLSTVYQPTLDRIAVFVAGSDGHLYDKYWNGREWVWEDQELSGVLPF